MTRVAEQETVRSVLGLAAAWLGVKGIESPRLDAEVLLAHVLSVRRLDLYLDHDRPLVEAELARFREALRRRAAREPVAWIVGVREFYGIELEVSQDVLVPRPETEHLVDAARAELARVAAGSPGATLRFVDAGTGSGCVAIALLAHALPGTTGVGVDVSGAALAVARRNVERAGVSARLELVEGDLLEPVRRAISAGAPRPCLVVSNPPYVLPEERDALPPEVLLEPAVALFDASAALPLTARLAREARDVLLPGGALAVETGAGRADVVARAFVEAGFVSVRREKDLAGIERVIVGRTSAPDAT